MNIIINQRCVVLVFEGVDKTSLVCFYTIYDCMFWLTSFTEQRKEGRCTPSWGAFSHKSLKADC